MMSLWWPYFILIGQAIFLVTTSPTDKIRVITWNVNDNSRMEGSFTDDAIDNVLGLKTARLSKPAIYAIGLQENCWMCNRKNFGKLADRFLTRINDNIKPKETGYEVVGVQATRNSSMCEYMCHFGTHGTTALVVIATKGYTTSFTGFRQNSGCHGALVKNKEKGVAAVKTVLKSGEKICLATAHLDSGSSSVRRTCLRNFFNKANTDYDWSGCDFQFLSGDFNTRTGKKPAKKSGAKGFHMPETKDLTDLKEKDEMAGKTPYGTDSNWRGNLLDYINVLESVNCKSSRVESTGCYKECHKKFIPTYSMLPAQEACKTEGGRFPCYKASRPPSWTDRVLYTGGECEVYEAVREEYGDHLPVFAEYMMRL